MNVYDFDETIYNGESSLEFFLYYFKVDPTLIKFLPSVIKALMLYKAEKITLDDFLNDYSKTVESYIATHRNEFERTVKSFWDKKLHKIKPFYYKVRQPDDVVITASPSFLIREACDRLGIKNLISTEIDLESGKIEAPCFREAKITRFREAYPTAAIDDFYTDSMNDRFLMPFAKRVFIVKRHKIKQVK
ncbi:MAG: haloacid dehalogenase-like hydrolase [Acutalibacteraceae bacterium]